MDDEKEDVVTDNPEQDEQQKKDKISKQHAEAVKFLTALFGGEAQLKPRKTLPRDATARVVALLFKQEQEAFEKKALDELRELLKKFFEFDAEIKRKRAEFDKLELQKKKEFVEAFKKVKSGFDQQDIMTSGYTDALKGATEALASESKYF